MATENVGSISASLELQTSKFEAGLNKADKSLNRFATNMTTAQVSINKSLQNLTSGMVSSTKSITKALTEGNAKVTDAVKTMEDTLVEATNFINKRMGKNTDRVITGLQAISTVSSRTGRDTVGAISSMSNQVCKHLSRINDEFAKMQILSSEDFTKGIKTLTNAIGKGTGAIIGELRKTSEQAKKTKKDLENIKPKNSGGIFAGLPKIFETINKITFQAFLLEQTFRQIADVVNAIVSPALDFASSMETLQLGYAGIISSTMTQYGEDIPYERALQISDALLVKMQDEALKTSLTIEELGAALQSSMALGLNAGMKLDQVLDLTVVAAQAVKTFGLSNQQVIQEIRGLISGDAIRAGQDTLATVLGYTTAEVNMLREEGRLYEDIMDRMKGFRSSSEAFQDTMSGLLSNLQDGLSRIAGIAGQGLFKAIKGFLKDLQSVFFSLEKIKKTINGQEATFFKVHLNESTLNILTHMYNTFANLLRIVHQVGKALGVVLAPLLEIAFVITDRLSLAGAILATGFEPVIRGVGLLVDALMRVLRLSDSLNESLLQNKYVLAGLVGAASLYAAKLAISFAFAFGPIVGVPVLVATAIGAISLLFDKATEPVDNFGKWLDAKIEVYKNRWEGMKEWLRWDGDSALSDEYFERARKAQERADKLWETWSVGDMASSIADSIANKVSNVVPDIKKNIEGLFDGLDSKYKASNNATSGTKTLSQTMKELEKVLKKINSEYEKLVGNSREYFETELIREHNERETKLEYNLELIESKIKSTTGAELELWKTRLNSTNDAIEKESALYQMKIRNYEATQAQAEASKIELQIQAEYLNTEIRLKNSQISSIASEEKLFAIKKSHAKEYIKMYQSVINLYETMANNTGNAEVYAKYKKKALDARRTLEEFKQAIHPVEKALRDNLIGGLSDAFQAMTWQEKSAKQALEDLAVSFTKTWTKMLFDTAVKDMFGKLFGTQGTMEAEIDAKVTVDTTQFKDSIVSSATAVQNCLINQFIPAIQQASFTLRGTASTGTPLSLVGQNLDIPSVLGHDYLKDFADAVKGTSGGLSTLEDTVNESSAEMGNATNFAIPMMIASVLSASGALGKFGIVLQHVMMMMQIAQATHIMGFATGGYVSGAGTGTSDSIPARLSDGEYVMKASSVNRLGVAFLDKLNSVGGKSHSGRLPKFAYADGGYVNGSPAVGNTVVMNNTFQSLDPMGNMKMMEQMYPQIRSMYINDLQNNTSVRNATRGAVK